MKEKMLAILLEMIDNGYCLFDETPEQHIDRMISYGLALNPWKTERKLFTSIWESSRIKILLLFQPGSFIT